MKAIIEFDLPTEQDAFEAANNGTKWKELVRSLQQMVRVMARTDESEERQKAYGLIEHWLRSECAFAGLSLVSNASIEQGRIKHSELWGGVMNEYLAKKGYGDYATNKEGKKHADDFGPPAKENSTSKKKHGPNGQQRDERRDNPAGGG